MGYCRWLAGRRRAYACAWMRTKRRRWAREEEGGIKRTAARTRTRTRAKVDESLAGREVKWRREDAAGGCMYLHTTIRSRYGTVQLPMYGLWALDSELWTLDTGHWTLDTEQWGAHNRGHGLCGTATAMLMASTMYGITPAARSTSQSSQTSQISCRPVCQPASLPPCPSPAALSKPGSVEPLEQHTVARPRKGLA